MKSDYQQQVINKIKALREKQGITQLAFSKMLGISPGQMGNIDSIRFCLNLQRKGKENRTF